MKLKPASLIYFLTAAVFALFFMFYRLGVNHLIEFDEGIYGLVAKNILKSGDWVTLQWNYGHPWFDKGPLYLWLTALSLKVFGLNAFAVRFWSALLGFVGCLSLFWLGSILYNRRVGFLAAVVLASTTGYLYYARLGMLDVPNAAFNVLALVFLVKSQKNQKYLLLAAVVLALAFLNRGFLGFLSPTAFFVYLLWKRLFNYSPKIIFFAAVVFLLILLPWHLLETLKYGGTFWQVYLGHQMFLRFAKAIEGKNAPLFWYITVAKTHLRLWFIVLLPALPYIVYRIYKKVSNCDLLVFLWALVTFVVFTAAKSKLIWYIMPLYPPLALLIAVFIDDLTARLNWQKLLPGLVLIIAVIYNFQMWSRIETRDFTADQFNLIQYKNKIAPSSPFLAVGYSYSVSQFYSGAEVVPIPKEELKGFFDSLGYRFAIISLGDLKSLPDSNKYKILYSTGDGALISPE
ncbi:MAG: glycosyltransferase family 39 protein [Patescibacteria group bacterium]|nr:glycosyltransferase family 39 protein [Patescibacteria group bacterium]